MIKAVFFDLANTLLHKPELYSTITAAFQRHGLAVDIMELEIRHRLLSEVIDFPNATSKDFYMQFNTQLCFSLGINPTDQLLDEIFESCSYLPWKPFEDTRFLKQVDLPMGIISNWDVTLATHLSNFDIAFSWVHGSDHEKKRKPDTAFYQGVLDKTGLDANHILYIGDSIKLDIAPALKLGLRAVLIDRNRLYPESNLERIRSLQEVMTYL